MTTPRLLPRPARTPAAQVAPPRPARAAPAGRLRPPERAEIQPEMRPWAALLQAARARVARAPVARAPAARLLVVQLAGVIRQSWAALAPRTVTCAPTATTPRPIVRSPWAARPGACLTPRANHCRKVAETRRRVFAYRKSHGVLSAAVTRNKACALPVWRLERAGRIATLVRGRKSFTTFVCDHHSDG